MTRPAATVSVVVAATGHGTAEALARVASAARRVGLAVEIILACRAGETIETLERSCPGLRVVRLPSDATLPRLLGGAIEKTRGDIIAITDTSCRVAEDWLTAIVTAHAASHPVIGGAVQPSQLDSTVAWAAYLCDYGQFMTPLAEGHAAELPGNNISVKRSILAHRREFVSPEFWKTFWCRQLSREGVRLHASPSIVVHYQTSVALRTLVVRRWHHGRCFAGMRLAELSALGRVVRIVTSPALPLVLTVRTSVRLLRKQRYRMELVRSFPICLIVIMAWAVGEGWGYVSGCGESCDHVR